MLAPSSQKQGSPEPWPPNVSQGKREDDQNPQGGASPTSGARIESFAADTTFTIEEPSHLRGVPMSARKVQTMVWVQEQDPACLRAVAGTDENNLVVRLS